MNPRLNKVSKIARIIGHQKEVIEFRLREAAHRRSLELKRLTLLERELQENIDRFEKALNNTFILGSEEVAFLFGTASILFQKIERKKREIEGIEKEWETLQALFLEAYKKKKAVEIFQCKIITQERKAEVTSEQKNMDYLNLVGWSRS